MSPRSRVIILIALTLICFYVNGRRILHPRKTPVSVVESGVGQVDLQIEDLGSRSVSEDEFQAKTGPSEVATESSTIESSPPLHIQDPESGPELSKEPNEPVVENKPGFRESTLLSRIQNVERNLDLRRGPKINLLVPNSSDLDVSLLSYLFQGPPDSGTGLIDQKQSDTASQSASEPADKAEDLQESDEEAKMPVEDDVTRLFTVSAIIYSPRGGMARIGGRNLRAGDLLGGNKWRILKIERTHVLLSDGTREERLDLSVSSDTMSDKGAASRPASDSGTR